jgi:hypothetical protein
MPSSTMEAQRTMQAYTDALLGQGDYGQYFSDDVVATLEGIEPQRFQGRDAVRGWIDGAHALGEVKMRRVFAGEDHAAGDFEFVRNDGVSVPYAVTYDLADGRITALRLYFTGPVMP